MSCNSFWKQMFERNGWREKGIPCGLLYATPIYLIWDSRREGERESVCLKRKRREKSGGKRIEADGGGRPFSVIHNFCDVKKLDQREDDGREKGKCGETEGILPEILIVYFRPLRLFWMDDHRTHTSFSCVSYVSCLFLLAFPSHMMMA